MKSLHLPLVTILLVVFGFIMLQIGKQEQIKQQHDAYTICLAAHAEINGTSERACGDALDTTHTEFLCSQDNKYCWLEVK